ncbi:MAG: hypothetical protein OdinLCB4_006640 [Candidatus Odinarchaeum yellowstonii]|uniref:Protein kinase domain-containing protein n=1 Tax=Odinarchaeota yellowstonii (strain LCB_4) TaxID=1841599 RepID=A0AAF0D210_ODILC|nr:MAG: hypothetical protein OdinLCB4_006640 [Candidatus Odinarchaeum yellowstonii]
MNVKIKPSHMMFTDGYKIEIIKENGQVEKHYMKFEDGIKNVFKWNVLSPFLAKLKIISQDYHIKDPQTRWENEIKVLKYLRNQLSKGEYPLQVPKITTNHVKKIADPELQKFLEKWKNYRYTILEYVEGPTLREMLSKPENYNLEEEVKLLGKCIAIMHSLGVCQFDRRTTNDIKIPNGYCCVDYSLAKIFQKKDNTYYRAVAFDIDNEKLWLPPKLFQIFQESHDQYLESTEDFNMNKYKKTLTQFKRLSKLSTILKPLLFQLDAAPL